MVAETVTAKGVALAFIYAVPTGLGLGLGFIAANRLVDWAQPKIREAKAEQIRKEVLAGVCADLDKAAAGGET